MPSKNPSKATLTEKRLQTWARWRAIYQVLDHAFHVDPREQQTIFRTVLKWLLLGTGTGILAGTASALFLTLLEQATKTRLAHPELLYFLPFIGFGLGWIYHHYAGAAARGNNLVIEEVHANREPIPLRMAPLVLLGTVLTHLFGGSAGREGTALQMGSSLADWLARQLHLSQEDRRLMLMAGISGGFGSVFGTPIAGFVFGLEVQSVGRIRYEGLLPCLVSALVGDLTTRAYGVGHSHYPLMPSVTIEPILLFKIMLAGIACGLTSLLFIELTDAIRHLGRNWVMYPPFRPVIGGFLVIGLTALVGNQDYLGLSLPLIQKSVHGEEVFLFAFLLKLIFTAITLGTGFLGGEVTPLFVMGSTLGYTLGRVLGIDPAFSASIGFVAVFAGATNTPLACVLMGVELFGGGSLLYLTLGCFMAYLTSGHRSIYITQRVSVAKILGMTIPEGERIETLAHQRAGWLPQIPLFSRAVGLRPVRAVMSPNPLSVTEDTPLPQILTILLEEGIRALPVVNQQKVVTGIITDSDLMERGAVPLRLGLLAHVPPTDPALLRAQQLMTHPVISLQPQATLAEATHLMQQHHLKRLPVLNEGGHLMGMLTRSDILRELSVAPTGALWSTEGEPIVLGWDEPVTSVMVAEVPTVAPATPVEGVLQAMVESHQKRVVVVDEKQHVLGIITDGDLLERVPMDFRRATLAQLTAPDEIFPSSPQTAAHLMTTPVLTITTHTPARAALHLMLEHRIKRLPVTTADGQLVGLIGRAGLLRVLIYGADKQG